MHGRLKNGLPTRPKGKISHSRGGQGKMIPTVSSTEGQIFNFEFVWDDGVNNGVSKCRPEGRQEGSRGHFTLVHRVSEEFYL